MTGFRVLSPVNKALKSLGTSIRASEFEPDVKQFLKRSLTTAIQLTPVRSASLIRRNQKKQYANRINYIPSFHDLNDPTLIVKPSGEQWLFSGGKWYRPDIWNLPDSIWTIYTELSKERDRRMQTDEGRFIEDRMQARFLFKRSWWEIGQSAGIDVACPGAVKVSETRRKPKLNPPKGYAQKRGGKNVYSILIRNPFLDQASAGGQTPLSTEPYKPFNGQSIIDTAMAQHRPAFEQKVAKRSEKLIVKALSILSKL